MLPEKPLFLILEDHPEIAQYNCDWLQTIAPNAECIQVFDPVEASQKLKFCSPDLAVVDLLFGKISGLQSARPGLDFLINVFSLYPDLNILIYSSDPGTLISLKEKINNHKGGFVVANKFERRPVFVEKAQSALRGELGVPRELSRGIVLSERELDVLSLMCNECLKDKVIAERLDYSKRTIQICIRNIRSKLGIDFSENDELENSRIAICMRARDRGFLG